MVNKPRLSDEESATREAWKVVHLKKLLGEDLFLTQLIDNLDELAQAHNNHFFYKDWFLGVCARCSPQELEGYISNKELWFGLKDAIDVQSDAISAIYRNPEHSLYAPDLADALEAIGEYAEKKYQLLLAEQKKQNKYIYGVRVKAQQAVDLAWRLELDESGNFKKDEGAEWWINTCGALARREFVRMYDPKRKQLPVLYPQLARRVMIYLDATGSDVLN